MKSLKSAIALFLAATTVQAADTSVYGTHWVKYEPIQVADSLEGCQIVFLAVTVDRAYLNGDTVAANGAIVLRNTNATLAGLLFTLKLGLRNMNQNTAFERPAFAYLQTPSGSTAKAEQTALDGDPGYRLFAYRALDPQVLDTLKDLISSKPVTIGYSRNVGGMDVLVPLDLTIVDSEYSAKQEVIRKVSPEVLKEFAQCTSAVLKAVKDK